jgi:hypothetical protein
MTLISDIIAKFNEYFYTTDSEQKANQIKLANIIAQPAYKSSTANKVAYYGSDGYLTASSLYWDSSNSRLGIGTETPSSILDIAFSGSDGILNLSPDSTETAGIQIGNGRSGNGYAYIDLVGDATYTDYGFRIIRNNTGANAGSQIVHRGTGELQLNAPDGGFIAIDQESVTDVSSFSNSWVNYGTPYANAGYWKDSCGVVHLRGLIKNGTGIGTVAFALPSGYRPAQLRLFVVPSNNAFGDIIIYTNGNVVIHTGSTTWVSLDGVTFGTN